MAFRISYVADNACPTGNHGTLHVLANGSEQFARRIDLAAGDLAPLSGEEQKDLAVMLLRYAMQREAFSPTTITQLATALSGRSIELDLVLL